VIIRQADFEDCETVAQLGAQFVSKLKMPRVNAVDAAKLEAAFQAVHANPDGVVLVAELDGAVVGFLGGVAVPLWFDPLDRSATELAWWVDPKHRGGSTAARLVRAFEDWAKDRGVARVVLSDVEFEDAAQPAGALIERLGYTMTERAFAKSI
tara:strand:+ start:162 stop:620 length:459 start_codon:yes stop_codon:yes gene_type:complete